MSRNDQAQAGHEGESEAKKEVSISDRAERTPVSHKRHGISVPCWRERSDDGVFLLIQSEAGARRTTQAGRPG